MDRSIALWRRASAEGLAAFALVFAGCGAVVTDARYDGALGAIGINLVCGLVFVIMAVATIRAPSARPPRSPSAARWDSTRSSAARSPARS